MPKPAKPDGGPPVSPASAPSPCALEPPSRHRGEELLSDLDEMLSRHCHQLGQYFDGRLAAYHQDLMQALTRAQPVEDDLPPLGRPRSAWRAEAAAWEAPVKAGTPSSRLRSPEEPPAEAVSAALAPKVQAPTAQPPESHRSSDASQLPPYRTSSKTSDYCQSERDRMMDYRNVQKMVVAIKNSTDLRPQFTTFRRSLRSIIESHAFEALIAFLIITNVCFLGVEVQTLVGHSGGDGTLVTFQVVEFSYTGCFVVEIILRLLAYSVRSFFCGDSTVWNCIDLGLVLISVAEACLELVHFNSSTNFTYLRIIRVARTVRVLRVVRIVKFFRPLRVLVFSICNTVRHLAWTLVLLGIIMYSFGLSFTIAASHAMNGGSVGGAAELDHYFGTLWRSIASLFKVVTGGIDWRYPADALAVLNPIWVCLFVAFVSINHFAILNVVTGVVCQTAIESAQQDQDIVLHARVAAKKKYIEQLQALFMNLDTDRSGQITLAEFEEKLEDPDLQRYFDALDLTADQAWSLFKLLDIHEHGLVDVNDFVLGCLRLRGPARSVDTHMIMYENKWIMKKLSYIMEDVRRQRDLWAESLATLKAEPGRPCRAREWQPCHNAAH